MSTFNLRYFQKKKKNMDIKFSIKEVFCYLFFHILLFLSFRPNRMKATLWWIPCNYKKYNFIKLCLITAIPFEEIKHIIENKNIWFKYHVISKQNGKWLRADFFANKIKYEAGKLSVISYWCFCTSIPIECCKSIDWKT